MKLNYYAIGVGGGVDLGGTLLFGTIITALYAFWVQSPGMASYELFEADFYSPAFLIISVLVGITFNTIGGYVAAQLAEESYLTYGALSSIPCILVGVFTLINPLGSPYPDWLTYLGKVFAVVFGILGGYLCKRHITSQ